MAKTESGASNVGYMKLFNHIQKAANEATIASTSRGKTLGLKTKYDVLLLKGSLTKRHWSGQWLTQM